MSWRGIQLGTPRVPDSESLRWSWDLVEAQQGRLPDFWLGDTSLYESLRFQTGLLVWARMLPLMNVIRWAQWMSTGYNASLFRVSPQPTLGG